MLKAVALLFILQCGGDLLAARAALPVPGTVIGLVLLLLPALPVPKRGGGGRDLRGPWPDRQDPSRSLRAALCPSGRWGDGWCESPRCARRRTAAGDSCLYDDHHIRVCIDRGAREPASSTGRAANMIMSSVRDSVAHLQAFPLALTLAAYVAAVRLQRLARGSPLANPTLVAIGGCRLHTIVHRHFLRHLFCC